MKNKYKKKEFNQINKLKVYKKFNSLLEEFSSKKSKIDVDLISIAIFFQMFQMRKSLEKYKKKIDRGKDITLAEVFQELIGHYLRNNLNRNYCIKTEHFQGTKGKKGIRPDFLILKNNKNHAIIEVSTNFGFKRNMVQKNEYKKRIKKLRKNFNIPKKRIFYVIETYENIDNKYSRKFERRKVSNILPLFSVSADPEDLGKLIKGKLTPSKIIEFAKQKRINSFKEIIRKIKR